MGMITGFYAYIAGHTAQRTACLALLPAFRFAFVGFGFFPKGNADATAREDARLRFLLKMGFFKGIRIRRNADVIDRL